MLAQLREKGIDRGVVVSADGVSGWRAIEIFQASGEVLLESLAASSSSGEGLETQRVLGTKVLAEWVVFNPATWSRTMLPGRGLP